MCGLSSDVYMYPYLPDFSLSLLSYLGKWALPNIMGLYSTLYVQCAFMYAVNALIAQKLIHVTGLICVSVTFIWWAPVFGLTGAPHFSSQIWALASESECLFSLSHKYLTMLKHTHNWVNILKDQSEFSGLHVINPTCLQSRRCWNLASL